MEGSRNGVRRGDWLFNRLNDEGGPSHSVRFGEVWWVKNSAWARDERLSHLARRPGWHRGLSIRPRATMMAFGTSKLKQAERADSRLFKVQAGTYSEGPRDGAFLLDYAVPMNWSDFQLTHPPALLPAQMQSRLREILEKGSGNV